MTTTACNHRLVIYAKDVMLITGRTKRASYGLLRRIRAKYRLPAEALITIYHFCDYTCITEERVKEFLK